MKFLADTHTYLWWLQDSERLSSASRALLADAENDVAWSVASTWEMAIKLALGQLELPSGKTLRDFCSMLADDAVAVLPIEQPHAVEVASLPAHHRDPFDRILIAQARVEDLVIVTADPAIRLYDVATVW